MKKILTITLFLLAGIAFGQDATTEKAVKALTAGDSKGLAALFADNLDLKIEDKDDIFSKEQAEQILRKFFEKNAAKGFKLVNSGETTLGLIYRIGELETAGGKYKVDIKLKKIGDGYVISILEIEKM
jgi:predicted secreted protein